MEKATHNEQGGITVKNQYEQEVYVQTSKGSPHVRMLCYATTDGTCYGTTDKV